MHLVGKKLIMNTLRSIILSFFTLFILNNCASSTFNKLEFDVRIKQISKKYILDKSLEVNEVAVDLKNQVPTFTGMTTNIDLYNEIKAYSDSLSFGNDVVLLPDPLLGDSTRGIINVSVAPIRDRSSHTAQMVDQAIMGNWVKILVEKEDWYLCQTHYNYVGWITKSAIHQCTINFISDWTKNAKHRIKTLNSIIYSETNISSIPISDGVLNNRLKITKDLVDWNEVILPDGRVGFIQKKNIELVVEDKDLTNQSSIVISNALSMKGVPYLWGGNSSKGNDCSGFTQTVFMASGIQLPRDARQQAQVGKLLIDDPIKEGDLLFFGTGDRVTHVGISMGGDKFIHQGSKLEGKVDIHSLNPKSPIYNSYRKETFLYAKRVIETSNNP
tara:strand:+ start:2267 stop:3424 length:1158 start_codon:yes stop_codon:yes gene_type:complete